VSIDRPEPADAPDAPVARNGPAAPDTPRPRGAPRTPSDPAVRDAYRAHVERGYAAHRDRTAWAEAVPQLRAAWAEHQRQYPERGRAIPRTHPDNSWTSGETRRLTPDQNTEAARACADIHEEGDRVILPAMRRIEAADPDRRLAGLEHMCKGADRLKEKIAERLRYHPDLPPRQAVADIPDAVRFTFEYSESHYAAGVPADIERLREAGYELMKLKNLWAKDQYKGINSQWLRPETGLRFEVQFHTPESREAKELTHKAYERLRDPHTSKAEESVLEDYQRRVNALIRIPPDAFTIEDYPPEKRDG
jgi:hypothetical protein